MAEVLFYHLSRDPVTRPLPGLLDKTRARGWRALIATPDAPRRAALDRLLWEYDDQSFLPHALYEPGDPHASAHPILIAPQADLAGALKHDILFALDGAALDAPCIRSFARVCVLFEESEAAMLDWARSLWRLCVDAKIEAQYWAQAERGFALKQKIEGAQ